MSHPSKKAVAVHEAGHLFVNLALQPSAWVEHVTVSKHPTGPWEGLVQYKHRFQWALADVEMGGSREAVDAFNARRRESAHQELLISLAGPIAETRWRQRSRWAAVFACDNSAELCISMGIKASEDYGRAKRYIEWLSNDNHRLAFREAWFQAEGLLQANWQRIVSFADRLKAEEHIGEEVNSLRAVSV